MYNILTIGDIKLDTFIVIPTASLMCKLQMPQCQLCLDFGKKIPVEQISSQIAGTASNVAIGIAKMDLVSAIYSVMGVDGTNTLAVNFLNKNNVVTRHIKTDKNHPSSFAAVLNYKGETTQLVSHGNMKYRLPKQLPDTEWMHISELGDDYEKLYAEVAKVSAKKEILISFNPGVVQLTEKKPELYQLLKATTVLFLNLSEAKLLLDIKSEIEIHRLIAKIKALGPQFVVITDGKNGAYAYDGLQLDFAPAFPGKMVEATGAGDAFSTGFLGALMHGQGHDEALRWGSVNATSVINFVGPTKGLLSHTEIKKRLKARPNFKTKEM
jgi:sugar/nucleoside kinase (ribokinase family)